MTQSDQTDIGLTGPTYHIAMSERPSDYLLVQRVGRELHIREPNGSLYMRVRCPALAAGADEEDLR